MRLFSRRPRFALADSTRRLLLPLPADTPRLWSMSLPSPFRTLPDLIAERLAELRADRSALALVEDWYRSYSRSYPALVRLRFPVLVIYQYLPTTTLSLTLAWLAERRLVVAVPHTHHICAQRHQRGRLGAPH